MLALFLAIVCLGTYAKREFPSVMLGNWEDRIITWEAAQLNPNQKVSEWGQPGVSGFRLSKDQYEASGVQRDSFALFVGNARFTNPSLFNATNALNPDGIFESSVFSYGASAIENVEIKRSVFFPPKEKFYIIRYSLQSVRSSPIHIRLLDFVTSAPQDGSDLVYGWKDNATGLLCVDLKNSAKNFLAMGPLGDQNVSSFTVSSESAPLEMFAKGGLDNQSCFQDKVVSLGFDADVMLGGGGKQEAFFVRTMGASYEDITEAYSSATRFSGEEWVSRVSKQHQQFLNSGKVPSLSSDAQALFANSVLLMKHSQNPTLGSYVASMHPAYGFKMWGRDSIFSAMVMDAMGYAGDARSFLEFASTMQLRDDGAFHTCYSHWTGQPASFVEPQFDSVGAFLLAVAHHVMLTGDVEFVSGSVKDRLTALENFLLSSSGTDPSLTGLVPPDYSIWEESSDGITGKPLPTSYFAFTQGMAFAGLTSAAALHGVLGDSDRQEQLKTRAEQLVAAVEEHLWLEEEGHYARGIWSDSLQPDKRVEGATASMFFSGMLKNETRISKHYSSVKSALTRLDYGVARYEGDPFFFDSLYNPGGREVGAASPPWGVVTCFWAWFELQEAELRPSVQSRLDWLVQRAAPGGMPVGEAVDGVSGTFVMSSCPDLYEYAGVYIWTVLMQQGLAVPPNPSTWKWKK